ncbi:MAG: hypothetical protein IMF26_02780 [Candidatus Fermentithermobacillus carboniphilus]|uniref:DUF6754 domain-containing protein n=1 Tax=Candidatus Fermentithermobacillus carboniphilus TaxID=3085328 RepID=A0AAT9LD84_9FIRM|nr:MAG: hypothetical protein IMF26_02780 [Candidatus Fermentithermobacillus carboniphilus]
MVAGKQATFVIFILFLALLVYYMMRARSGKLPFIRRIPGLDAIEEAVGRATELGRPVFYVPGRTEINTAGAAQTIAGLEILEHVAKLTARYDTDLKVGVAAANVYPVADAIVRQSYLEEGKPEKVRPEMVQFLSNEQFAFAAACLSIMNQDQSASVILIGEFQAESMMLAEGAAMVGAVTIAGTSRTFQIPFFVAACDYTLIGEEMFAGGAYLSKDPGKTANLAAQDIGKIFAFLYILIGSLLVTIGYKWPVEWLKR